MKRLCKNWCDITEIMLDTMDEEIAKEQVLQRDVVRTMDCRDYVRVRVHKTYTCSNMTS